MKTTKKLTTLMMMALMPLGMLAQEAEGAMNELTTTQAKATYKTTSKRYVSVHDPSVVWEPSTKRYYIFGSHKSGAYTTDLQNWAQSNPTWRTATASGVANKVAFTTPQTKTVTKGGEQVDFINFNAMEWSERTDDGYNIDGNMWAPDVLWNETMQKWCMYLSINGDAWHSSIILLTADKIAGPYLYQGPVVICGFDSGKHSYKDTDLELVLGTQASLPSRYANSKGWAHTSYASWPHTIDPCVFFDEEGQLWMAYGSWSGGIFMLKLNKENGLRDYDTTYPVATNSDPYFGKRIAGGYYVSGEAPYIEYINGYYYLFVTYGFLDSVGGYVMRVFRSDKPDGPYKDAASNSAIFSKYVMNYGKNADKRGVKIMGAYADWGFMSKGELAQGHNSIIASHDGKTYLVYHTRFDDGYEGHQVRVHQVFQTKTGWLVAAPFEYNGENTTDSLIAHEQRFSKEEIAGTYQLLNHKYDIDYKAREVVTPVKITLAADGTISGAYNGTWTLVEGTGYITLKLGATAYNGVIIEQQMDGRSIKTVSFSALAANGVNVWGYKMLPQYAVAWQVNNQKMPVHNGLSVKADLDLDGLWLGDENVSVAWTSSRPDIIDEHGHYNAAALQEDTDVTLTVRVSAGNWYWQQSYTVKAVYDASLSLTLPHAPAALSSPRFMISGIRQSSNPRKGVYIQNGKKFVIK